MLQIFNKLKNPKPSCFENIISLKDAGFILSDKDSTNNYKGEEDGFTAPPKIETETESQPPLVNEPEVPKQKGSKDFFTFKDVASFFPDKSNNESESEDLEEAYNENRRYSAIDESRQLPPSDAEEIVQSWASKIIPEGRKRVVVYMTSLSFSSLVFEACKTVRLIFMRLGVMVEEFDMLMDSSFINELQRIMQVDNLSLPRVFIGGRYVGGADEVMKLNDSGQLKKFVEGLPETEPGICEDCGGYKFVLCNSTEFRTCTACNDNVSNSVLGSSETRLRICFKAMNEEYEHVYLIYSVQGSWLANQPSNPPTLNRDAVIFGHHSMGCGVYDSKMVFVSNRGNLYGCWFDGFITYDMKEDIVSYNPLLPPLPSFRSSYGNWPKPLVFQLNKKLYFYSHEEITLFFTPAIQKDWGTSSVSNWESFGDRKKCSCLVVGNSCCISPLYSDVTFIHHSNYDEVRNNRIKYSDSHDDESDYKSDDETRFDFVKHSDASLPFSGHATSYHQNGFDDFVIIYFENGVVRVFLFDFFKFGDSQLLFMIDSCTVGGTMHGYFADFGYGCFCLTAFNETCFHLYTFKITRYGKQSDPLKVQARILSRYYFEFDCFCTQGNQIDNVVGCFAPDPNTEDNSYAEEVAARTRLKK